MLGSRLMPGAAAFGIGRNIAKSNYDSQIAETRDVTSSDLNTHAAHRK